MEVRRVAWAFSSGTAAPRGPTVNQILLLSPMCRACEFQAMQKQLARIKTQTIACSCRSPFIISASRTGQVWIVNAGMGRGQKLVNDCNQRVAIVE
jgi:hypothetical protein